MKPNDIELIRQDFPDLIAPSTVIDSSMPDQWLLPIREMLSAFRALKAGRRFNLPATELHVRSLGVVLASPFRRPSYSALACVYHAPDATGAAVKEIKRVIKQARGAAVQIDVSAIRAANVDLIESQTSRYIRACIAGGRLIEVEAFITSGDFQLSYLMPQFVAERVKAVVNGATVEGVDETTRSRFLDIFMR